MQNGGRNVPPGQEGTVHSHAGPSGPWMRDCHWVQVDGFSNPKDSRGYQVYTHHLRPLIDPKVKEFLETIQRPNPGLLYETPPLSTAADVIKRLKEAK